jgi:hypothetical protein
MESCEQAEVTPPSKLSEKDKLKTAKEQKIHPGWSIREMEELWKEFKEEKEKKK